MGSRLVTKAKKRKEFNLLLDLKFHPHSALSTTYCTKQYKLEVNSLKIRSNRKRRARQFTLKKVYQLSIYILMLYEPINHNSDQRRPVKYLLHIFTKSREVTVLASGQCTQHKRFDQLQSQMNPAQLIQNRSTLLIFRDCLKLASRMVTDPVKVTSVRRLIKTEFEKNRDVVSQQYIRELKLNAVRGISNYIIYTVKQQYNLDKPRPTIYDEDDEMPEPEQK